MDMFFLLLLLLSIPSVLFAIMIPNRRVPFFIRLIMGTGMIAASILLISRFFVSPMTSTRTDGNYAPVGTSLRAIFTGYPNRIDVIAGQSIDGTWANQASVIVHYNSQKETCAVTNDNGILNIYIVQNSVQRLYKIYGILYTYEGGVNIGWMYVTQTTPAMCAP